MGTAEAIYLHMWASPPSIGPCRTDGEVEQSMGPLPVNVGSLGALVDEGYPAPVTLDLRELYQPARLQGEADPGSAVDAEQAPGLALSPWAPGGLSAPGGRTGPCVQVEDLASHQANSARSASSAAPVAVRAPSRKKAMVTGLRLSVAP